jgi:sugar diacid utilization regulator
MGIIPKPLTPKEMTQEQRQWKKRSLEEHLEQLIEAEHYAQQDVNRFILKFDISRPDLRVEAERALADTRREIAELKQQISDINAI